MLLCVCVIISSSGYCITLLILHFRLYYNQKIKVNIFTKHKMLTMYYGNKCKWSSRGQSMIGEEKGVKWEELRGAHNVFSKTESLQISNTDGSVDTKL